VDLTEAGWSATGDPTTQQGLPIYDTVDEWLRDR
jgi:hypothetical protein